MKLWKKTQRLFKRVSEEAAHPTQQLGGSQI